MNETNNHSPLFKLNNSKHNKNIISFFGLFMFGVLFYITFGVNILIRQEWMATELHGSMDLFVHFCIWPVVLPTIYFMRNPKNLKSVLQDHNLMQIDHFEQKNKKQKKIPYCIKNYFMYNRRLLLQVTNAKSPHPNSVFSPTS